MPRNYDVWPVVFVCWRSKAEETLQSLAAGTLDISYGRKIHIRKGARILVVSEDGSVLGLGTRHGAVALARVDKLDGRAHPDLVKAFDCPVTTVSFSQRGRWLATGGDRLQLWTWED